ncbi:3-deoxy-7-phosphoheptulonate synthase [Aliagarivorans taiwanensis]|uniref:3-deoxy-7-phosphoheptulonate synthase n=1 Tax=Aliagarivorans taiwanensis TaxID=561966 RepID=UPI00042A5021|nr:3-deoxy-7-phosphoheptulonate synthase [Aliagarivorans taiwanensis]
MSSLEHIRERITSLDQNLLTLLNERRQLSVEVAKSKLANPKAVRDQEREQQLLIRLVNKGRELGLDAHYVTQLYHTIIEDSVLSQQAFLQELTNPEQQQSAVRVAFLGSKGSYSNIATHRYFSRYQKQVVELGCVGFQEIVDSVESGQADYGILPIENTSSGSINEVYDVLQQTSLSIVGELSNNIDHGILAKPGSRIDQLTTLYAHPQPYQQCSRYLRTVPGIRVEFVDSSSKAMEIVANSDDPNIAALGSSAGGEMYGLQALQTDIANQTRNETRFIVVSASPIEVADQVPARTTLIMSTSQQPGSLVEALLVLREHKINMSKLESRPVQGNPWEEMFYIDVSANVRSDQMQSALAELSRITRYVKVLGCYPSEDVDPTQIPLTALVSKQDEQPSTLINTEQDDGALSSRSHKPSSTVIRVGDVQIGDGEFITIAGPGAVESQNQIMACAQQLKESGGAILQAGCFKPRSSPYSFQGLGEEGLGYLSQAGKHYHVPVMTEVSYLDQVATLASKADILYVRARHMQNFNLLRELGKTTRPVVLERNNIASLDEWLKAADFILAQGNQQVILCESGVRTFEGQGKATLDLSAIPLLRSRTHLPVIVNPGEAIERREQIAPLAKAAKQLGADGLLLWLHPDPEQAKVDNAKSLSFPQFSHTLSELYS